MYDGFDYSLLYLKVVVIDVLILGIMFGVMLDMQEFL